VENILKKDELKEVSVGSPEYFRVQKKLIFERPLLKHCYDIWYSKLTEDENSVPSDKAGKLLELGSGGSYLKDLRPEVITSDVVDNVADLKVDARHLPFEDQSLRAIFATHTIHHIPEIEKFFQEAERTLVSGGVISLIEVAKTPLAKFLFTRFHPEPFIDETDKWSFDQIDSMLDSNQALSWIVFFRDKKKFEEKYPSLVVEAWSYLPWLSYILSGGVTKESYIPSFLNPIIYLLDKLLTPFNFLGALHWHIRIRKK